MEPSVFTKIINRELPADIVFEDERIIVIKNIHPQAPVHLLGITKHPFVQIHELLSDEANKNILWELFSRLGTIATELGIDKSGYKLVTNCGEDGGQSVPHLHVHLLGGGKLAVDNL
ncbi:MAG: histidine triad nucleotide-binding protein [Patescibacteria group bacterium]|jgi:histidine triad (HIT) family protein|nr:histidine triad nucleotide-binding protein [Patescibacteria group bacterium]